MFTTAISFVFQRAPVQTEHGRLPRAFHHPRPNVNVGPGILGQFQQRPMLDAARATCAVTISERSRRRRRFLARGGNFFGGARSDRARLRPGLRRARGQVGLCVHRLPRRQNQKVQDQRVDCRGVYPPTCREIAREDWCRAQKACCFTTVAQPAQNLGEAKYFDFKRAVVFCLENRFSKHKTTKCAKKFGRLCPCTPLAAHVFDGTEWNRIRLHRNIIFAKVKVECDVIMMHIGDEGDVTIAVLKGKSSVTILQLALYC